MPGAVFDKHKKIAWDQNHLFSGQSTELQWVSNLGSWLWLEDSLISHLYVSINEVNGIMWFMSPASVLCALNWEFWRYFYLNKIIIFLLSSKHCGYKVSLLKQVVFFFLLLFKNYFDNKHWLIKDLAGRYPTVWFLNEVFFHAARCFSESTRLHFDWLFLTAY